MKKRVFVVLGMARSGTSAIAKALNVLGVDLGDKLLSARSVNPKGFYEDTEIMYGVNRRVISLLGNPWISSNPFADAQFKNNSELHLYKSKAVQLLQQRFATTQCWGFKDPRTVGILHFWQEIFTTLDVDDSYIITMRDPLSSASSNQKYMQTDIEVGLVQWMTALISAVDGTRGKNRVIISYDLMLENPRLQLERMHKTLAMTAAPDAQAMDEYANNFLDKKMRHHVFDKEDLRQHPAMAVAPLCLRMYDLLLRVARDEITFACEEFEFAWREIKNEFSLMYPVYQYLKKILAQNKELQREIRSINKSIPWKLVYPLRKIDNLLRARRRAAKTQKRLVQEYGA